MAVTLHIYNNAWLQHKVNIWCNLTFCVCVCVPLAILYLKTLLQQSVDILRHNVSKSPVVPLDELFRFSRWAASVIVRQICVTDPTRILQPFLVVCGPVCTEIVTKKLSSDSVRVNGVLEFKYFALKWWDLDQSPSIMLKTPVYVDIGLKDVVWGFNYSNISV